MLFSRHWWWKKNGSGSDRNRRKGASGRVLLCSFSFVSEESLRPFLDVVLLYFLFLLGCLWSDRVMHVVAHQQEGCSS